MEQTYLTHPWVFTNKITGEAVYAQYFSDRRKHFEVLRFAYDQLKKGKVSRLEFQRKVRGEEYVDVGIVGSGTLTEISTSVIAKHFITKYGREEDDLDRLKEASEKLDLVKSLKEEVINAYKEMRKIIY